MFFQITAVSAKIINNTVAEIVIIPNQITSNTFAVTANGETLYT